MLKEWLLLGEWFSKFRGSGRDFLRSLCLGDDWEGWSEHLGEEANQSFEVLSSRSKQELLAHELHAT